MSFDGTRPGLGEARLAALVTVLQTGLPVLNALLGLDSWTSDLIAAPFGPVQSAYVRRGDLRALWKPQAANGLVRLRVAAAGHRDGLDFTSRKEYIDETSTWGRQVTLFSAVFGYLHGDGFRDTDPDEQAERIEVARERLSDWIRATLNQSANKELVLASQEYWPTGDTHTDRLSRCGAEQGYKGAFDRGFGGNEVAYGVHVVHTGLIA
jgi:hypothetical protein